MTREGFIMKYYVIFTDAGHGLNTSGKRTPIFSDGPNKGKFMKEREFNKAVVLSMHDKLKNYDCELVFVSANDTDVPLPTRTNTANARYKELVAKYGKENVVAVFVSIHANAFTGNWGNANGIETFYHKGSAEGANLAKVVNSNLIKATGRRDRGIKDDNLHITRETSMLAILCECGFMDYREEAELLMSNAYRDKCATAIVDGLVSYMKLPTKSGGATQPTPPTSNPKVTVDSLVESKSAGTVQDMKSWAKNKGATATFINNADLYYEICNSIGVNPVMAYAQYALESGYGKYGGVVDESFKNPCGLKTNKGGDCKDPNAHQRFNTWTEGVSAHVQHMALYAGMKGYPLAKPLDPRHFPSLLGTGKTIATLAKGWCPSNAKYPQTLVDMMIQIAGDKAISNYSLTYEDAVAILVKNGVIATPDAWKVPNVKYIDKLVENVGEKLYNCKNYEHTIGELKERGKINSPDIWLTRKYAENHVRSMVIVLAQLF